MKKKNVYLSVGAAVIIVLASLTSVIGFTSSQNQQQSVESPLFTVRTSRSIGKATDHSLNTVFLGKGKTTNVFLSRISSTNALIERGLQLLRTSPVLIEKSLRKTLQDPSVQQSLREKGISEQQVIQYFNSVKNNPEVLAGQFDNVVGLINTDDGPQPLGLLNTSNAMACIITAIVLLPIFLILALVIATITIVTCLNVNNCFDTLMDNILQGLHSS